MLLAWLADSPARGQSPYPFKSLSRREVELVGNGTRGPYLLPGSFILVGTEEVLVQGQLLTRGKDYLINYTTREITFSQSIPQGTKIKVEYRRLPVRLKPSYAHQKLVIREGKRGTVKVVEKVPILQGRGSPQKTANLRIGGSKGLGISIGSGRDLALEQTLRVNISGTVARDVEVVALLSDESNPIQPEGSTQTLEELDQVFLEVRGTHLKTTLGDYNLSFQNTEFGQLNRKLEGIRGEANYPNARIVIAGGASPGEFTTNRFSGVEGKQGPYQLWGKDGTTDIVILAGTERVWVNGQPKVRGENNDYIIDYSTGQITFTRHCLITAESRIVVDFEYTNQRYKRDFYGGRGRLSFWDGKLWLGTTFIREADDRDSPLVSLSEADRAILAAAGDDPSQARKDTRDTSVYLPMPISHSLYGLDVAFSPFNHSHLQVELALSRFDPNTFSNRDSSPGHLGKAYKLAGTFRPHHLNVGKLRVGSLDLSARYRFLNQGFRPLGRIDMVEYDRRWDLPPDLATGQEKLWEIEGTYYPFEHKETQPYSPTKLNLCLGRMWRGNEFRATRREFGSRLSLSPYPRLEYRLEQIDSRWNQAPADSGTQAEELTRRWIRQRFEGDYTFWKLRPRVGFESEVKEQFRTFGSGFRFYSVKGGISTVGLGRVAASVDYEYRDNDRLGSPGSSPEGWWDESTSQTWTNRFSLRRQVLSLTAEYIHRVKSFQRWPRNDQKSDLADLKLLYSPWRRAIFTELHYQISNLQEVRKEQWFEDVGEWLGDYRRDETSGEYIYDPGQRESRYVLRWRSVGDSEPVTELRASARLRLTPHQMLRNRNRPWGWLALLFSTDTYFRIEESTRERNRRAVYLLNLERFQQDETTLRGNLTVRQDLFLFPTNRHFNLRLRYRHSDNEDNQLLSCHEERLGWERSVRARWWPGNRLAFQLDYGRERVNRKLDGQLQYDIWSHTAALEVSHRPRPPLEVSLGSEYDQDQDQVSHKRSVAVTFSPKISYSFQGKGRVWANFRWTHVWVKPQGTTLPYWMARGGLAGESFRWNLRLDYRLNRYLTALVSYSGQAGTGRPTTHSGRAEMRAYF